jgi:hypothetical protein
MPRFAIPSSYLYRLYTLLHLFSSWIYILSIKQWKEFEDAKGVIADKRKNNDLQNQSINKINLNVSFLSISDVFINVREYRRGTQKWTIQGNWQHRVYKRKTNKTGKSRETGNIGYTRGRQTKQRRNTICVGHHYMQANINNVKMTNLTSFYAEIVMDITCINFLST